LSVPLYVTLSKALQAYHNCVFSGDLLRQAEWIAAVLVIEEKLPPGSKVDLSSMSDFRKLGERILIIYGDYKITLVPSFLFGFDIAIKGPDKGDVKEYLMVELRDRLGPDIITYLKKDPEA
jgi:hypothetical protein